MEVEGLGWVCRAKSAAAHLRKVPLKSHSRVFTVDIRISARSTFLH